MLEKQSCQSITRIGVVVQNLEKSVQNWTHFLDAKLPVVMTQATQDESHDPQRVASARQPAKLAYFQLENIVIELIEPLGPDTAWKECLDELGEGIHHISFTLDGEELLPWQAKNPEV